MPGMKTPTLLQMSRGYQIGGFVTNPFETIDYSQPFQDMNQQQVEQSLNIQPTPTTTPAPPSPAGGGTATTTTDFSDPTAIATSFGLDPEQYSEYFTAITPEMQAATEEATYDPFFEEEIAQLRSRAQQRTQGLQQNLLQSEMRAQQAAAASGFAGGAAGGQRTQQSIRQAADLQQSGIGSQYEAGKRGVQQIITSRIGAAQDAIERAKQQNIKTAMNLVRSGAEFGFTPDVGTTPDDINVMYDTPEMRYSDMASSDSLLSFQQRSNALPRGFGLDRPMGAYDPRTIRGY